MESLKAQWLSQSLKAVNKGPESYIPKIGTGQESILLFRTLWHVILKYKFVTYTLNYCLLESLWQFLNSDNTALPLSAVFASHYFAVLRTRLKELFGNI